MTKISLCRWTPQISHLHMSKQRMDKTRIKFCGLTQADDVDHALTLGVDEMGLVFAGRKRNIDIASAARLAAMAQDKLLVTGLFMNPAAAAVHEVLAQVALDRLQFHGNESPEFCAGFGRPWIKAISAADCDDLPAAMQRWQPWQQQGLQALLLDAHAGDKVGGSGERFDWSMVPRQRPLPIYLAGGLTADNVAAAIAQVRPETVDVSSGIETSPGRKCPDKMQAFVNEVKYVFESGQ